MEHMDLSMCLTCGEAFTPRRLFADGRGGKFCSRSCQQKYVRRRPPAEPRECEVCGRTYTPGRQYTDGRGKVCSRACRDQRRKVDGRASLANRRHLLWKKYGVTIEQYHHMLAAQAGACAICGRREPVGRAAPVDPMWLHVDHDHDTGQVRGLLCSLCNTGIGYFGEDLARMEAAMNYLRHHNPRSEGAS